MAEESADRYALARGGKVWGIPIRLSVLINVDTQEALKILAERHKWSIGETVNYAINLSKLLMDEEKAGREIYVTNRKGKRPKRITLN